MRKEEKIMIAVLVVIMLIVIIFAVTRKNNNDTKNVNSVISASPNISEGVSESDEEYVDISKDGTKVNTSEALATNKTVRNVEFSSIQLAQKNGQTVLVADIQNTGTEASEMFAVNITLLNEQGQDVVTVGGIVTALGAGESSEFQANMTLDFANVYDFRVEEKTANATAPISGTLS